MPTTIYWFSPLGQAMFTPHGLNSEETAELYGAFGESKDGGTHKLSPFDADIIDLMAEMSTRALLGEDSVGDGIEITTSQGLTSQQLAVGIFADAHSGVNLANWMGNMPTLIVEVERRLEVLIQKGLIEKRFGEPLYTGLLVPPSSEFLFPTVTARDLIPELDSRWYLWVGIEES